MQQMHDLNMKFVHLFGMAADHVASSIVNGDLCDVTQSRAKAMNDAISRRTKLPDFLNWGRQFDDNMKALLVDTWHFARQNQSQFNTEGDSGVSPGLAAFCGNSTLPLNPLISAPTSDETADNV